MTNRSRLVAALTVLAVAGVTACGGGTTASGGGPAERQNLAPDAIGATDAPFTRPQVPDLGDVAITVDESFQDYNNNTGAANSLANQYFVPMWTPSPYFVDADFTLKLDRDYMESVTVTSQNPQVVEWKWRPEAVWSDGAPVDCDDMYLLYLAARSPARDGAAQVFDSGPTGYDQISRLDCTPDGRTVTATFSTPYADYRGLWSIASQSGGQLLPAHILEQRAGIPDITKVPVDRDTPEVRRAGQFFTKGWTDFDPAVALSAGPYRIERATRNQEIVLVRNEKWWGNPGGPARITATAVTDSQSAVQKLLNKEVQVIQPQADPAIAEQVRAGGDFTVFARAGQTFEHIDFNMARPLFRDNPELRKAFAACVNREDIVGKLIRGVDPNAAPLGNVLLNPGEAGYVDHYAGIGTGDVPAARTMMETGGWVLGPDGIYAKGAQRASIRIGHKLVDRRAQTVQLIAGSCRPAGIEVVGDGQEAFNDQLLPAGDFDAALFAWVGGSIKSSITGNYSSKSRGGAANYNDYSNPAVDDLLAKANTQLDFTQRQATLNEADALMARDLHTLPLFSLTDFSASVRDIGPVSYVGATGGALWNAFAWQKR